jgi:hypothetical protein
MLEQLQKKLEDVRVEMIQKQVETPLVHQLTADLETEWVDHQKLFLFCESRCAALKKEEENLQRIELAMREVHSRWPMDGEVKRKKGFPELEALFEEALAENRELGQEVSMLTDEVEALEEMNHTLKAVLEGVKQ